MNEMNAITLSCSLAVEGCQLRLCANDLWRVANRPGLSATLFDFDMSRPRQLQSRIPVTALSVNNRLL